MVIGFDTGFYEKVLGSGNRIAHIAALAQSGQSLLPNGRVGQ